MATEDVPSPIRLVVEPQESLADAPLSIQLQGLEPGQQVTLHASTLDGWRCSWASWATFVADEEGTVDVNQQAPLAGSYEGVDALGLLWSMTLQDPAESHLFVKTTATPLTITLNATCDDQVVASARIQRLFAAPGVQRINLEGPDMVGTLFLPSGPGPHPCVILLNGSDGGFHAHSAALLASHGFAAFALAYFGVENCPPHLLTIPLEYFEQAFSWLGNQPAIDSTRLAICGLSRGAELALLLASTFPAVKAVIAGSPSSLLWPGLKGYRSVNEPAWTYRGEALPYLAASSSGKFAAFLSVVSFLWGMLRRKPFRLTRIFLKQLQQADPEAIARASIAVERIAGPILLVAGSDDQVWPSCQFAERIRARLEKHGFSHSCTYLLYEGAGHFICCPYGVPSLPPWVSRGSAADRGPIVAFGGTALLNAHASQDCWYKLLSFLQEALERESQQA